MNLISKLAFLALAKASAAGAHEFVRGNQVGDATQAEVEDAMGVGAKKAGGKLHVKILHCKDIPDKDTHCFFCGETDAYAVFYIQSSFECREFRGRTTIKRDTLNPVWNEEFDFNFDGLRGRTLYVSFWDQDFQNPFGQRFSREWELRLHDQGLDDKGTTKELRLDINDKGGHCMIELGYAYYSCYKEKVVEKKWSDCGKGCPDGWRKDPSFKGWTGNVCGWFKKNWPCQKVKLDCPSPLCRRCSASEIAEEALGDE